MARQAPAAWKFRSFSSPLFRVSTLSLMLLCKAWRCRPRKASCQRLARRGCGPLRFTRPEPAGWESWKFFRLSLPLAVDCRCVEARPVGCRHCPPRLKMCQVSRLSRGFGARGASHPLHLAPTRSLLRRFVCLRRPQLLSGGLHHRSTPSTWFRPLGRQPCGSSGRRHTSTCLCQTSASFPSDLGWILRSGQRTSYPSGSSVCGWCQSSCSRSGSRFRSACCLLIAA
mmetsp:Transcript_23569/g.89519  ORF Transcript_23569/g.89519 Transcript_23569/m.89519 type:complete len:227 (+) Transcript_23569:4818-5498(+)